MKTRYASIVTLKRQPNMVYLVAEGCPHPRPDDAPFYACATGVYVDIERGGEKARAFAQIATCTNCLSSKDADDGVDTAGRDRVIECSFGDGDDEGKGEEVVGNVGMPTVRHVDGEDDGSHPD